MRGEFPSNGPFGAGGERRPIAAFHFASALSNAFGALPATSTTFLIVRSISLFAFAMPFAIFLALATPTPSDAEWTPSAELHFRAEIVPDTLTVGDPIALILEGSAPAGGDLLVPSFADSVGPFTLLGAEDVPVAKEGRKEGEDELRVSFSRRLRMTAFDTGRVGLAPIPLLWVSSEGDTSVAYSDSLFAEVVSVLPDSVLAKIGAGDQQAALAQIRDAKGPEELVPSRLWLWILLGAVAVALLTWAALRYLRRKPAAVALPAAKPAAPKLPPELAFRKGLDALVAQKFVEKGEFKEYYAELSLLLRRYVEGRFGIPAVEETEREIVEAARADRRWDAADVDWLRTWLRDADLVKFAKMDRLAADATRATEEANDWVARSTKEAQERARVEAMTPPAQSNGSAPPHAVRPPTVPLPTVPPPTNLLAGSPSAAGPGESSPVVPPPVPNESNANATSANQADANDTDPTSITVAHPSSQPTSAPSSQPTTRTEEGEPR